MTQLSQCFLVNRESYGSIAVVTSFFLVEDSNQKKIEGPLTLVLVMLSDRWRAENQDMTSYFHNLGCPIYF